MTYRDKFKVREQDIKIITEKGREFDVPVEGSLGLLSLGAVGLAAWRKKRKEVKVNKSKK